MPSKTTQPEKNPVVLRDSIIARLPHRCTASGRIRWPAIPALLDHYTQALAATFAGLGRAFSAEELDGLRATLATQLAQGFEASPFSKLIVAYKTDAPPSTALSYSVSHEVITLADEYGEWVQTRQPPLFGSHPDAKVLSLARSLGSPPEVAILDVGAGTGRNTLPLANQGFAVDAVELAPSLAAVLRRDLERAGVSARVFEGDALDPALGIPEHKYRLVVLAEVVASHFRDVGQLRKLLERASAWLAPGGLLLFSAFLAAGEYEPDLLARQASQVFWCCLFTRRELEAASRGLPLLRVSDESTYAFEHSHLPEAAWPPTGWFEDWARGGDLFELPEGQPPHELRWVVYRKTAALPPEQLQAFSTTVNQHIRCAWERVFDVAIDADRAARIFRPLLPIPGIARSELLGADVPGPGVRRRITWTDGSSTLEELLEFERPVRLQYRWTNTLRGPLSLLMRTAESDWTFAPTPTGTVVYWTYRFEPRSRFAHPLMNIVLAGFRRWMRQSLHALREIVEA
jgi:SAM-dependent methyltransferase